MKKSAWMIVLSQCVMVMTSYGMEMPLREAAIHNDLAAISDCLENGIEVNAAEGSDGKTALHLAAQANRLDAAQLLIENDANINARDSVGVTPLHLAALNNHLEMVQLLLNYHADINAVDYNGLTPLHMAAQYGHRDILELLIESGADLNAKTNDRGLTPLHWAAFWGHTEAVKPLLAYGADINARDNTGDTPLGWAEEFSHYDMARLIARKGGKRHLD